MLANSFLKAEALGITEAEVAALIKVLGMLERGELSHGFAGKGPSFSMITVYAHTDCGTVGCIAGYVALHMKERSPSDYAYQYQHKGALSELYFPRNAKRHLRTGLSNITPEQGAIAVRNFLTTGAPRWSEALEV